MKAHGFRDSFTPLLEVLFTFPSRYLCAIGLSVVFSLAGWAPLVPAEFLVLRGTQVPACLTPRVSRTGLSPSTDPVSTGFRYERLVGASPVLQPRARPKTAPVWASARSLATTCAIIIIFFSSGYLDVSVPRVRPPDIFRCDGIAPAGFPHSDIRGSQGICPSPRLFAACHVLLRLREPQASPMRPFCLSLFLHLPRAAARAVDGFALMEPWSIKLGRSSTRFLRFDLLTRRGMALAKPHRGRRKAAASLYSSRSQHVNDLFFFSP